ncbi:hypothetical protein GUJ93_ZPchr0002g24309 [Zizania palustris]|uniref:Uncharacterized protein n=1 Tax=Zizania palustris TaxID=103762 RepID=A0A8J5S233_ZIZPA|nr:hypothetical protein GUJ93_ZPchr0001g31164 [Zizania palustris]KAG8058619.1 hypothetical protein GUJ93_ZPchr0002g24309 [Zizania palustris]
MVRVVEFTWQFSSVIELLWRYYQLQCPCSKIWNIFPPVQEISPCPCHHKGVVLAVEFQLSCGDNKMNTLIWYSWLGGVIIGTMIGAKSVLEEHCKPRPCNVVIIGSIGLTEIHIWKPLFM